MYNYVHMSSGCSILGINILFVDAETKLLLLRALSEILKQASNNGQCKVAYLEDKSLNYPNIAPDIAVPSSKQSSKHTSLEEVGNDRESRNKRKYPFSSSDDDNDVGVSNSKKESLSTLSPSSSSNLVSAVTTVDRKGATTADTASSSCSEDLRGGKISKEYLSLVLSNIEQSRSEPHEDTGGEVSLRSLSTALSKVSVPRNLLAREQLLEPKATQSVINSKAQIAGSRSSSVRGTMHNALLPSEHGEVIQYRHSACVHCMYSPRFFCIRHSQ